jgi:hypothetical protein
MPLSLFHLHGDLKDLRFPRLLAALREDDFTGVFQASVPGSASEEEITREVHFLEGSIAWAISTDPEESLRAYLLRNGAITEAQWLQAEEKARETSLRQALVDLGLVASSELTQIERGRAEEIVLALFTAERGEYRVRERQLSPGTPHLKIDPRALILKGVLEGGDRALILEEIGSLDTVYVVKRPVLEEPGLNLPGEFQSVLRLIDGKRSIAQICSLTAMPDYFVCSVFAALSMVGAVRGSHARSQTPKRPPIVRGADVSGQAPAAPAPSAATPAEPEPPIATQPFEGEGPITLLDDTADLPEETAVAEAGGPGPARAEQAAPAIIQEPVLIEAAPVIEPEPPARPEEPRAPVREPAPRPAPARVAPEPRDRPLIRKEPLEAPPRRVPPIAPPTASAPATAPATARTGAVEGWRPEPLEREMPDERSRPWFLLGGAMAVGAAALFLILMAQGSGDAVENVPLPADPTLQAGAAPAHPDPEPPAPAAAREDVDETTDSGDRDAPPIAPAAGPKAPSATPPSVSSSPEVATPPASRMLEKAGDEELGHQKMLDGDYRAAARHFGREVAAGSGGYTIQLLMACQDDTVKRAVESGRSSPEMFILSTAFQGRSCYRVYWGRYPTQKRAQEALLRDIPTAFRSERPRVTRLAGS